MKIIHNFENNLFTITDVAKKIGLVSKKTTKPLNHTIRFWEKEFSIIKPTILNKRKYYTKKDIEAFTLIKFLLKDQGLTITGAKKVVRSKLNKLDDYNTTSIKALYIKKSIKNKSKLLLEKINKLKLHGKKNTYKS